MARFGKKAELDTHKSTQGVECLVSVAEDGVARNKVTGQPVSYYVEAQRLQDQVSPEDAKAGLADSNPFITSKKEYYRTLTGETKEKTSHVEQISAFGMEQIKKNAVNQFDTVKKVFDSVTGEEKEKVVHNFIVRLNIGFSGPDKTAFFYVPKAVNRTEQDERYSFRNMPKAGRELTQEILDRHAEITRLAKEAAMEIYKFDGVHQVEHVDDAELEAALQAESEAHPEEAESGPEF